MLPEKFQLIIDLLEKKHRISPSEIASKINSDRRTVNSALEVAGQLGLVECQRLDMNGRTYSSYSLTPAYKKLRNNGG